jgi:hypothetical protein
MVNVIATPSTTIRPAAQENRILRLIPTQMTPERNGTCRPWDFVSQKREAADDTSRAKLQE